MQQLPSQRHAIDATLVKTQPPADPGRFIFTTDASPHPCASSSPPHRPLSDLQRMRRRRGRRERCRHEAAGSCAHSAQRRTRTNLCSFSSRTADRTLLVWPGTKSCRSSTASARSWRRARVMCAPFWEPAPRARAGCPMSLASRARCWKGLKAISARCSTRSWPDATLSRPSAAYGGSLSCWTVPATRLTASLLSRPARLIPRCAD